MGSKSILVRKPKNFSFDECLWFLDRDLDDCMHRVFPGSVRKLLLVKKKKLLVEITEKNQFIQANILNGTVRDDSEIVLFLNEWFDLDRDIEPFYKLLRKDPDFKKLATDYLGLRMIGIPDFFEVLCWCVIGQQINLAFAYKIKRRLVERYGESVEFEGLKYYIFPRPEVISNLLPEDLKEFQMTTKKAEYLIGIAREFVSGKLSKSKIAGLREEKKMLEELIKIRGIGEWTANYAIMKGLRAMNGIPFGDSGLNQALLNFKNIPKKDNRKKVEKIFSAFAGWKTYLVFYLWRSLRQPLTS